jgi:hypothetical protein
MLHLWWGRAKLLPTGAGVLHYVSIRQFFRSKKSFSFKMYKAREEE